MERRFTVEEKAVEPKIRYLEMIQNVISRMASNSFLLKGWAVTIVVGLLAFANLKDMDSKFIIIALVPTIFFWILDSFFLQQERMYIKLYEHATTLNRLEEINFSLSAEKYQKEVDNLFKVMFSKTLGWFYGPIILVIVIALFSFKFPLSNLFKVILKPFIN